MLTAAPGTEKPKSKHNKAGQLRANAASLCEVPNSQTARGGGRSRSRTRLSLHFWEMQGDFDEMQGGAEAQPSKSR
jgi:hypothetical protein